MDYSRVNSSREITITENCLLWQMACQKKFKNEDGSPNSDNFLNYQSVRLLKRSFVENLLFEDFGGRVGDVDIQSIWRVLVTHYSSRNLTVDADKVRAISGIAEALRRRFALKNFHYGLWMDSLCEELTWYADGTLKAPARRRGKHSASLRQQKDRSLTTS
jgi:hypothetical protein